jgi:hypothetical protein
MNNVRFLGESRDPSIHVAAAEKWIPAFAGKAAVGHAAVMQKPRLGAKLLQM